MCFMHDYDLFCVIAVVISVLSLCLSDNRRIWSPLLDCAKQGKRSIYRTKIAAPYFQFIVKHDFKHDVKHDARQGIASSL